MVQGMNIHTWADHYHHARMYNHPGSTRSLDESSPLDTHKLASKDSAPTWHNG